MKPVSNISFVIIALNEEFAIKKCLGSLSKIDLDNCEIICVDSGSKDKTLEIMKSYKNSLNNYRIFQIQGYANSAIARNIGIRNATKKYIYFVDSDIELFQEFIENALEKLNANYVDAVTGNLKEIQYDQNYAHIIQDISCRTKIYEEKLVYISGGTFLAKREVINEVGFFDEKFERSQDNEFTLRFTRKFKMLALPCYMGVHHTVPYENSERLKKYFLKGYPLYKGMIVRRNLMYFKGLFEFLNREITGFIFGLGLLLFFLGAFFLFKFPNCIYIVIFIYFLDMIFGLFQKKNLIYRIALHYLFPIGLVVGLFFDLDLRHKYSIVEILVNK